MKIFFDKIAQIRKDKGLSVLGMCKLAGITRASLWKWEKGLQNATEQSIRNLAQALGVSANIISDLKEEHSISTQNLSTVAGSWDAIANLDDSHQNTNYHSLLEGLTKLNNDISQAKIIINALVSSMETIFYIKDKDLNYIVASDSFLNNLNLKPGYKIYKKSDIDFFSKKEAEINIRQDEQVFKTGEPIKQLEMHIPGSRKKKWGLISKYPILDSQKKISGIIGVVVDITDRKHQEERRELLEAMLDKAPVGVTMLKYGDEKFNYINKSIDSVAETPVTMFWENSREFFGVSDIPPHEELETLTTDKALSLLHKEEKKLYNKLYSDKNSYFIPFKLKLKFIFDEFGDPKRYIKNWLEIIEGIFKSNNQKFKIQFWRNINEQKQKELESEIRADIIDNLMKNSEEIIWTAEIKNNTPIFTYLSDNSKKFTGYSISDFNDIKPTDDITQVSVIFPNDAPKPNLYINKKSVFDIIHSDYHRQIKIALTRNRMQENYRFKLLSVDNKVLNMKTSISKKEVYALNTVYYGKAKVIKNDG